MASTTSSPKKSKKNASPLPLSAELRSRALELETQLEEELWRDAIFAAQAALDSLTDEEGSGHHFDRRRGLRIRAKASKVDAAFNRLRALRRGEMLPPRVEDEF